MKFFTFAANEVGSQSCLGVEISPDKGLNISKAAMEMNLDIPRSMIQLIDSHAAGIQSIQGLLENPESAKYGFSLSLATYLPPIDTGKNIFCVGRNYREHVIEGNRANGRPENQFPEAIEFFTKPRTALIGHRGSVRRHANLTNSLDYEVELAIIIGKRGIDIDEKDALKHVFGYTVVNDITARDLQKRHGQWFKGKGLDTSCPMGPVITHFSAIADPNNLALQLEVNGETRQKHNTNDMIFNVQRIISELSAGMTLEPGDVISTGTPQGVGFAMNPPQCLNLGDVVEAQVEGIGTLKNTIVD